MSLLLYSGERPRRTTSDLQSWIDEIALRRETDDHLVILPGKRHLARVERDLIARYASITGTPLRSSPLHTFESLVSDLYHQAARGRKQVSSPVQAAMIERAMNGVELTWYRSRTGGVSAGMVDRVTSVISGLRADGVTPDVIQRDIALGNEARSFNLAKLKDLHAIYTRYLAILGDEWIDAPGRMLRVLEALQEEGASLLRKAFPKLRSLLFYEFPEFSPTEILLLRRIASLHEFDLSIEFDYTEQNGPLYGNFHDMVRRLGDRFASTELDPIRVTAGEIDRRPIEAHLRANLFRTDQEIPNPHHDDHFTVFSFVDRQEEARGIASFVKYQIVANGISPESIALALPNLEQYASILRNEFAEHRVPVVIVSRDPLDRNGLISSLFSLLEVASRDFHRDSILAAMASPYFEFQGVDKGALTAVSAELRITRGKETWLAKLESRREFLQSKYGGDADRPGSRRRELQRLERAQASVEAIGALLDPLSTPLRPADLRYEVESLLRRCRVAENLLAVRQGLLEEEGTDLQIDSAESDSRALSAFLELLEQMTALFEQDGDQKRPLGDYLEQLRVATSRATFSIAEEHRSGVLIGSLAEVRGGSFDLVILGGLVDGWFPTNYSPASMLGRPLAESEERHRRRERMLFHDVIRTASKRVVLTHPRVEGESDLVRSPFVDALLRITTLQTSGGVYEVPPLYHMLRHGSDLPDLQPFRTIMTDAALSDSTGSEIWQERSAGVARLIPGLESDSMKRRLALAIDIESERSGASDLTEPSEHGGHSGFLGEDLTEAERERLQDRSRQDYSVSQLELYAKCPFWYFAERELHVERPSDSALSLTPLERGLLIHTILFRLYTELREKGEIPITAANVEAVVLRAREIALEEMEGIEIDHPWWEIDRDRLLGSDETQGLLEAWCRYEVSSELSGLGYVPQFYETAFGASNSQRSESDTILSSSAKVTHHDVGLRGVVDRIEILDLRDSDTPRVLFVVADYKTGKAPEPRDLAEGLSLQLPIYMEVIRHVLAEHFSLPVESVIPAGGYYYELKMTAIKSPAKDVWVPKDLIEQGVAGKSRRRDLPESVDDLNERIAGALERAREYVDGIAQGTYHLTPHDPATVCRYCPIKPACRIAAAH